MLPCPTEITWPPEIGSLLNTLFISGHGGGRGAGAGLGAVPRQVRAGARVRVSGGRGAGPGAGQEGRPSLDCSQFIVQLPIKIDILNKKILHSHSTHILLCSPVSRFFCKYIKEIRFQNYFQMKSRINEIRERVIVVVITSKSYHHISCV